MNPPQAINAQLDTVRRVATAEGCELNLRIAGPLVRARAWLIDLLIRLALFFGAVLLLSQLGHLATGAVLLFAFIIEWFYPILFEVYAQGATPGKRLSKLAVLHDDGTPVGWGASIARNTLRFVDFLPFGYASGLITMWLNSDCKRLGDLLAGTIVVYCSESRQPVITDDYFDAEISPFALTLAEQRALLEYRQRAASLTRARADELAQLAVPFTEGLQPEEAKMRLYRIANALLGRRKKDASEPA
jgi:uncharacterized RDD family membrane protein YckC